MSANIERALVRGGKEDAELQARRVELIAAATHKSDATAESAEESERRKRKEEEEAAAEAKARESARLDYCWPESLWWSVQCCLSYSCLRLTSAGARQRRHRKEDIERETTQLEEEIEEARRESEQVKAARAMRAVAGGASLVGKMIEVEGRAGKVVEKVSRYGQISVDAKSTLHKIQFIDEDSTELVHLSKSESTSTKAKGFKFILKEGSRDSR
ncbi:hypothetical protein EMIHUDRAFT_241443 [Emiliania huxleyi CCMP1516]|uniref:Uncharacterized protein n=2 Tax=Emiliania huxleyi TaxID=2903 RepID=A0A0D3JCM0_EMIH1|nr:hypothetical protein EMIHUDRAFT_241443 [Emiliania huxleyi CCMP1516]EOD21255.1 hypothetical protein EMIHUDRAFT_241443 [Emiliania huxleyi CCMP1516]|eukprot:XP_005773684.1 hypothetical protein EMIHUDRAFT_241443 [Emiliania huxleyi CCMP1516]